MAEINGFRVWDEEFDREHYTPEEIALSDLQAEIICAFVEARKEKGLTQSMLEDMTGIKQPQIARLEKGHTSPQLDTLVKLLAAMGKKLTVVSM